MAIACRCVGCAVSWKWIVFLSPCLCDCEFSFVSFSSPCHGVSKSWILQRQVSGRCFIVLYGIPLFPLHIIWGSIWPYFYLEIYVFWLLTAFTHQCDTIGPLTIYLYFKMLYCVVELCELMLFVPSTKQPWIKCLKSTLHWSVCNAIVTQRKWLCNSLSDQPQSAHT